MTDHVVGTTTDFETTDRLITEVNGIEIAIFEYEDEFYALPNYCLHQGGPCAEGPITGTTDASFDRETLELSVEYTNEGMIVNCPWHSWEYDITTGECLSRNNRDLPTYPVRTDNNQIIVNI